MHDMYEYMHDAIQWYTNWTNNNKGALMSKKTAKSSRSINKFGVGRPNNLILHNNDCVTFRKTKHHPLLPMFINSLTKLNHISCAEVKLRCGGMQPGQDISLIQDWQRQTIIHTWHQKELGALDSSHTYSSIMIMILP